MAATQRFLDPDEQQAVRPDPFGPIGPGDPTALPKDDPDAPVYVISVAAELSELHPQTLRAYERDILTRFNVTDWAERREKVLEDWLWPQLRSHGFAPERFRTRYTPHVAFGYTSSAYTDITDAVTNTTAESEPCSASMSRSAASRSASADSSAITSDSVGPSTIIVTAPWRCISIWAADTAGDPGPTILRTRGIRSVPNPAAPIAAGPLARTTVEIPSLRHTTSTAGSTSPHPPGTGGTNKTISGTSATTAGTPSWYATEG